MLEKKYDEMIKTKADPLFEVSKNLYRAEVQKINNLFKEELFKEHGVENNPKREECFRIAWSNGHSSGYGEVEIYFDELVELIK